MARFIAQNLKPYDLVTVNEKDYRAIGQVISRPTIDGTIMVRRVPDDPNTMVELPLDKLSETTIKWKWVHYAVVSGWDRFPVDMLRYDVAAPANFRLEEDDRGRITTILQDGHPALFVARCSELKAVNWTTERWRSFGWTVSPLKTLKIEGK